MPTPLHVLHVLHVLSGQSLWRSVQVRLVLRCLLETLVSTASWRTDVSSCRSLLRSQVRRRSPDSVVQAHLCTCLSLKVASAEDMLTDPAGTVFRSGFQIALRASESGVCTNVHAYALPACTDPAVSPPILQSSTSRKCRAVSPINFHSGTEQLKSHSK